MARLGAAFLAREYRVVRGIYAGSDQSTPMSSDYAWRHDQILDDVLRLLDHLGVEKAHVIGAKIGGTLAMLLAVRNPQRLLSFAAVGAPVSLKTFSGQTPVWCAQIRDQGVEPWVRIHDGGTPRDQSSKKHVDWWIDLMMAATAPSTLPEGFLQMVPTGSMWTADLPAMACRRADCDHHAQSAQGRSPMWRRWQRT